MKTNPRIPLKLQRRIAGITAKLVSGDPENFGLPKPNHRFLEAHPDGIERVPVAARLRRRDGQARRRRAAR